MVAKISSLADFPDLSEQQRVVQGLRWIGLFSSEPVTARGNLLDTLCATLEQKMQYEKGEKDMVMLQHKFEIETKDGAKVFSSTSHFCFGWSDEAFRRSLGHLHFLIMGHLFIADKDRHRWLSS